MSDLDALVLEEFQLTTSRRGRPVPATPIWEPKDFNSRPHEEVDGASLAAYPGNEHFNSRPHEEVDSAPPVARIIMETFQLTTSRRGRLCRNVATMPILLISTHDLTKRSTVSSSSTSSACNLFQLTTSRRGRPFPNIPACRNAYISTHDLTKRSTVHAWKVVGTALYFNSRPHEEVDDRHAVILAYLRYFNSRPHEEVDC